MPGRLNSIFTRRGGPGEPAEEIVEVNDSGGHTPPAPEPLPVLTVEQRMHELDSLLAAEVAARAYPHVAHCRCGAPLPPGVHFCSHCGRPAATAPPVVTCSHCGQPLPAEANFCGFCGNAAAAEEYGPSEDALDATLVRPAPDEPEARP